MLLLLSPSLHQLYSLFLLILLDQWIKSCIPPCAKVFTQKRAEKFFLSNGSFGELVEDEEDSVIAPVLKKETLEEPKPTRTNMDSFLECNQVMNNNLKANCVCIIGVRAL